MKYYMAVGIALFCSVAAALVGAAIFNTWTEDTMMIVTVAGSISCLSVPIGVAIGTYMLIAEWRDRRRAATGAEQAALDFKQSREISILAYNQQRLQTEMERTRRAELLASAAQPAQIEGPGEWWDGVAETEEVELAPICL